MYFTNILNIEKEVVGVEVYIHCKYVKDAIKIIILINLSMLTVFESESESKVWHSQLDTVHNDGNQFRGMICFLHKTCSPFSLDYYNAYKGILYIVYMGLFLGNASKM